jgi:hypothetical protein
MTNLEVGISADVMIPSRIWRRGRSKKGRMRRRRRMSTGNGTL